jgi:Peptidase family M28
MPRETDAMPRDRLIDIVERFAFPRQAGSDAERRAAGLVADRFAALGLAVAREPFHASPAAIGRFKILLHGGGAVLGAAVCAAAAAAPALGAALGAGTLLLLARATRWSRRLERAFDSGPQIESQNIVARRPARDRENAGARPHDAASDASDANDAPAPHIVVLAHVDSKSMRWPTFVPATLLLVAALTIGVCTAWSILTALGLASPIGPAAAAAAAALVTVSLALGLLNSPGNESPGAMDNASGIAVLLALAERLSRDERLAAAHLTFLATGAEEIGLAGAMRWTQRHAGEYPRDSTLFINIDSAGVGSTLLLMDAHGRKFVAQDARGGPTLRVAELARRVASQEKIPLRIVPSILGVGVDTMPIASRGFNTVTILGDVLGPASRRIHTPRDTILHLHEAGLARAAALAHALAAAWCGGPRLYSL